MFPVPVFAKSVIRIKMKVADGNPEDISKLIYEKTLHRRKAESTRNGLSHFQLEQTNL